MLTCCNFFTFNLVPALFKRKDGVWPSNRFSPLWREQRCTFRYVVSHELWNNSNVQAGLAKLWRIFKGVYEKGIVGRRGLRFNRQRCQRRIGNRAKTVSVGLSL